MTSFTRCSAPSAFWSPLSRRARLSPRRRLRVSPHRTRRACWRRAPGSATKEDRYYNPYEGCQQDHEHEGQHHYFYGEALDSQSCYSPLTARTHLAFRGHFLSAAEIPHSV